MKQRNSVQIGSVAVKSVACWRLCRKRAFVVWLPLEYAQKWRKCSMCNHATTKNDVYNSVVLEKTSKHNDRDYYNQQLPLIYSTLLFNISHMRSWSLSIILGLQLNWKYVHGRCVTSNNTSCLFLRVFEEASVNFI